MGARVLHLPSGRLSSCSPCRRSVGTRDRNSCGLRTRRCTPQKQRGCWRSPIAWRESITPAATCLWYNSLSSVSLKTRCGKVWMFRADQAHSFYTMALTSTSLAPSRATMCCLARYSEVTTSTTQASEVPRARSELQTSLFRSCSRSQRVISAPTKC